MTASATAASGLRWQLGELDALRGIAILEVMLVHAIYWGPDHIIKVQSAFVYMLAFAGQRGVQLFFIVSAFTLYLSAANRKSEKRPLLNFFIRRYFRISPMFYAAVVIAFFCWREVVAPPRYLALSAVYLNGFLPSTLSGAAAATWSVATEAAFYMTFPLLFRWVNTPQRAVMLLAVLFPLNWAVLPRLEHFGIEHGFLFFSSIYANYPVFCLGVLGYFIWNTFIRTSDHTESKSERRRFLSSALLVLTAVLYVFSLPFHVEAVVGESAVLLLFVLCLLLHPWPFFVNRFTIWMGKLSFSLYLLHPYVSHWVQKWLDGLATRHAWAAHSSFQFSMSYVLTFVFTLPVAVLTWTFIEAPGIRLGQRLIRTLESRASSKADQLPGLSKQTDIPEAQF